MTNQEKLYHVAKSQLGVTELPGKANNPTIINYIKTVFKESKYWSDSDTAWCSVFVNWCCQQAVLIGTGSAYARSWLGWGIKITHPVEGDLVIFSRGSNKALGHVSFFQKYTHMGLMVQCLGGNQNNAVRISVYPRWKVLGYRRAK